MNSDLTQAKTGVEVERLPELPIPTGRVFCYSAQHRPKIEWFIRPGDPGSFIFTAYQMRAYATAALAAERAEAVRMRKLLETVKATLPHMGGNSMSTHNLLKDIDAALSPSQGEKS